MSALLFSNLEPHEFAAMFPSMEERQLTLMIESVKRDGLRHPVIIFENKILDGRHRYRACAEAGIDPRVEKFNGDRDAALRFVIDHNLSCRRHLTESQRAMVAAQLVTMKQGTRTDIPPIDGRSDVGRAEAAEKLKVGVSSVDRARRVRKTGAPALVAAVEKGDITVAAAVEIAKLPLDRQLEIVANGPTGAKEAIAEMKISKGPSWPNAPAVEYSAKEEATVLSPKSDAQDAVAIWKSAKAALDQITKSQPERHVVLREILHYCERRLDELQEGDQLQYNRMRYSWEAAGAWDRTQFLVWANKQQEKKAKARNKAIEVS